MYEDLWKVNLTSNKTCRNIEIRNDFNKLQIFLKYWYYVVNTSILKLDILKILKLCYTMLRSVNEKKIIIKNNKRSIWANVNLVTEEQNM